LASDTHKTGKKLTAEDNACDPLADNPHALRDIRTKFFNSACEIVAHDSAIVARLHCTFKSLPY
jgi:hypothetical protein